MKVLINTCFGGYALSKNCLQLYNKINNSDILDDCDISRHDPNLIKIVSDLGPVNCGGPYSALEIIDIPDGTKYEIDQYDGLETIHEVHKSWS